MTYDDFKKGLLEGWLVYDGEVTQYMKERLAEQRPLIPVGMWLRFRRTGVRVKPVAGHEIPLL